MGEGSQFKIITNRDGVFLVGKRMRLQFSTFRQAQAAQKRLQPALVNDQPLYVAQRGAPAKNRCVQCGRQLPLSGAVLGCRPTCDEQTPDKNICHQCYARVPLCSTTCLRLWQSKEN